MNFISEIFLMCYIYKIEKIIGVNWFKSLKLNFILLNIFKFYLNYLIWFNFLFEKIND